MPLKFINHMNSKFTQSSDGYYSTTEQTTGSAIVAPHVWIRVLLRGGGEVGFLLYH